MNRSLSLLLFLATGLALPLAAQQPAGSTPVPSAGPQPVSVPGSAPGQGAPVPVQQGAPIPIPGSAAPVPVGGAAAPGASASGAYVREVFEYPRFARPNPVQPPAVLMQKNAFPDIRLSGILFDDKNPGQAQAVIRMAAEGDDPRPRRFFVRKGDRIARYYRIAEITRNEVHVDELRFGAVKRVILKREEESPSARPRSPSSSRTQVRPQGAPAPRRN